MSAAHYCRVVDFDSGSQLRIWQASVCDVGGVVWDAALALAHWLDRDGLPAVPRSVPVVELGCGTGLVGMKLAQLGYRTFLTDLPELLPLVRRNIAANADALDPATVSCHALDWSELNPSGRCRLPDWCPPGGAFVVVCDCLYYEGSVAPLLGAMRRLATRGHGALIAYEMRPDKVDIEAGFFRECESHFESVRVPLGEMHPEYSCPEIAIVLLRPRLA